MRLVGFFILLFSSGVILFGRVMRAREELSEYREVGELLHLLSDGMERSVDSIFALVGEFCKKNGHSSNFARTLESEYSLNPIFSREDLLKVPLGIKAEDVEFVREFFKTLGRSEAGCASCVPTLEYMKKREKELRDKLDSDAKTAGVIYLAAAMCIFLLVI